MHRTKGRHDKERIFAWHVLPINQEVMGHENEHLEFLQKDKSAKVIIYCIRPLTQFLIVVHGTASHIGQTLRLDTYRLLTSANPNTHLITLDYRGWGYSTGAPTEDGVITDGSTVLDWVINTAHVNPSRILLVSQSLGTAIAMGVATRYHEVHPSQPLAGIVAIAAFTSLQNLVGAYRMAGIIPLLGPLNIFPKLADFFIHKCLRAEFNSAERLGRLVLMTVGTNFSVTLVHAKNDWEISYLHSRKLFDIACAGDQRIMKTVATDKITREIQGGRIRHIETSWGGHNDIQKSDAAIKAVLSAWR